MAVASADTTNLYRIDSARVSSAEAMQCKLCAADRTKPLATRALVTELGWPREPSRRTGGGGTECYILARFGMQISRSTRRAHLPAQGELWQPEQTDEICLSCNRHSLWRCNLNINTYICAFICVYRPPADLASDILEFKGKQLARLRRVEIERSSFRHLAERKRPRAKQVNLNAKTLAERNKLNPLLPLLAKRLTKLAFGAYLAQKARENKRKKMSAR